MNENREYDPWPLEIKVYENGKVLELSFDNNKIFLVSAELLRVESPSAEVQGHGPNEKKILPGKQAVAILAVEQVGNYAVKLSFDDGHDTGIYSWKYLYHLGSQKAEVWSKYLERLASKGMSRT